MQDVHRDFVFYRRFLIFAAVLAGTVLVAAPAASAQDTAAVSQYVAQQPTAGGESGAGGAGGAGGSEQVLGAQGGADEGVAGTAGEAARSGGGSLPFTGYPLTSYVWIVLSFLLAGLLVRVALTAYRRWQGLEPQAS